MSDAAGLTQRRQRDGFRFIVSSRSLVELHLSITERVGEAFHVS